jgi:hypothetical protein
MQVNTDEEGSDTAYLYGKLNKNNSQENNHQGNILLQSSWQPNEISKITF